MIVFIIVNITVSTNIFNITQLSIRAYTMCPELADCSIRVFHHIIESSSNGAPRGRVSNNYASLECGAKVIATNEEANVSVTISLCSTGQYMSHVD